MKSNKIFLILILPLLLPSCTKNTIPTPGDFDWNDVYKEDASLEVVPTNESTYFKASHDYARNTHLYWDYAYVSSDGIVPMTDEKYNGSYFDKDKMFVSQDGLARVFTCPKDGTVSLKGKIYSIEGAKGEAALDILVGSDSLKLNKSIKEDDAVGYYFNTSATVKTGDKIYFVVKGNNAFVSVNPIVDYSEDKELLYQVPDWNFYGDVHPFYHEGTMYMYNLEGYLQYPEGQQRLTWRLHTSNDMFNYKEVDYEVFDFVKNHYNESLYVYKALFDNVTYPYGSRDMFLFFDHLANKYVYFGLCYHQDMSSCLGARQSDDETGTNWSGSMYSIKEFAQANDPECNQAVFIGNRWYLITSIWGESIHSVGKPTYYIGKPNVPFLENDWEHAKRYELDGEDLCAAQLVDVGGRYLMYGWIPKTSYGNDEEVYFNGQRIHGLWGGNINQPHEVYQLENGELRCRMDEKLSSLLNRGKLVPTISGISGSKDFADELPSRSYITAEISMNNDNKAGLLLKSNDKTYKVLLAKEDGGMYLSIGCDEDVGHPIASKIKINATRDNHYHLKLIVDHSIFEAFVNDEYALTARTSLFNNSFYLSTYAHNSKATFSNIDICKLANQLDIYDN